MDSIAYCSMLNNSNRVTRLTLVAVGIPLSAQWPHLLTPLPLATTTTIIHPTATMQQQQLLLHLSHHQETTPLFKRTAPAAELEQMDVAGVEAQIVAKESRRVHMGNHFEPSVTSPLTPLPTIRPMRKSWPPTTLFISLCATDFFIANRKTLAYICGFFMTASVYQDAPLGGSIGQSGTQEAQDGQSWRFWTAPWRL